MADETDQDDGDKSVPAQIPLLEDIVEFKRMPKTRRRKQRDNYALDLDPDPPRTRDLFDVDDDAEPQLSGTELDEEETPAEEPRSGRADESSQALEAQLRARADTVVDDLVREYSREIIERLRQELTTLLDELNRDDEH